MFCAVWIIYAADRLLDTRTHADELELRHHFHARHRRALLKAICFAAVALALLTPSITWAQLRLDVVLASVLFVWMLTIHTLRRALPKEFLVGPFFAAAAFIPCANWLHILLPAVLFAALCTLNCLSIRAWEQRAASPTYATLALMVIAAATPTLRPITAAIALAALLLLVLQRTGRRFDATTLRALADLALLTPLLLAFWPK